MTPADTTADERTVSPERIAELRAEILRLNAKLGDAQMLAAHNHSVAEATRAERDNLRQLLDDACEDESEIHRRLDAVLPPDTLLTVTPLMGGRTPLCGDDGRVAQLVNERDAALTAKRQADTYANDIEGVIESIAQVVTGGPDTAGIVNKVEALVAENARLRDLPEWIIRKLKTMEYYESPTDDRDIRSEIQGWLHVLCFHYVHSRREVKAYSENCKAMKQLQSENARLRDLLARVKRVLPPGELYESILNALHEEKTP